MGSEESGTQGGVEEPPLVVASEPVMPEPVRTPGFEEDSSTSKLELDTSDQNCSWEDDALGMNSGALSGSALEEEEAPRLITDSVLCLEIPVSSSGVASGESSRSPAWL